MDVLLRHEHALTVVVPQMVAPPIGSQKVVHSRCFQLPKCRSVFLECVLDRVVLSSIGRLQASLTVTNRWKQSIKYVHMNIEKKIEAVGCLHGDQSLTETTTVLLDTKVYKLFTRVVLSRISRTLDEGQPCEQAGFRKGVSTIDHIHTMTKLIEVSREFKLPLCPTFIDLKKAFDSVETEAVIDALLTQGVPTQYIRVLRELYSGFTTKISPCYDDGRHRREERRVGLPPSKRKIAVGETYSFSPSFNVPALPPNAEVPGLLRISYLLNVSVGRAHNFVIASLKVPLTIVTDIIDLEQAITAVQPEDLLIDLTPSAWATTTTAPTIDLLA
ncbi:unnamed protein product [Heligmosomoides polygyrus]|uniref:Reverse transcriptase domain-containing protein n=1 Tax=Heligmosomoides polygyrus TaxID=6339 RepID=A0A183FYM0_HELPZ|nr:unnamed protein product [Heligmosomoides polygyrus]